jgi:hypothetical protein
MFTTYPKAIPRDIIKSFKAGILAPPVSGIHHCLKYNMSVIIATLTSFPFFRDEVFEGDFMMGDHDSKYIHYKITVQLFHGGYGV